jgi:hypothetical protein
LFVLVTFVGLNLDWSWVNVKLFSSLSSFAELPVPVSRGVVMTALRLLHTMKSKKYNFFNFPIYKKYII